MKNVTISNNDPEKTIAIIVHNTERNATETVGILEAGSSMEIRVAAGEKFAIVGLLDEIAGEINDNHSTH